MRTVSILLIIFAGTIARAATPANGEFNVRDYGAVGDGTNLDSAAIDRTIAAAANAGGGTVRVPAGTYLSGSIHLRSNIHLLIDAGATILGAPQNRDAYDETEPFTLGGYQDGGHCFFHNSLLWGENLTNVSVTGHGLINGGGLVRDDEPLDRMVGFNQFNPPVTNAAPPVRLGNKAIALKLCRNVLLRDITIFHGGHFAILVTGCDDLTVDNVTMDTDRDGIDIDCCRNTMVSNCRINSPNDDGLCPKSTFALGERRLTENLTIVNCQVSAFQEGTLLDGTMKPTRGRTGRIKFGTESSGGFRNCTIANCTFRNCHGLALEEVDGGILENITIQNLAMMDVADYAIYLTTGKRNRTPGVTTNSRVRNILISNVIADGVGKMSGIQIMGLPEQPIEDVRIDNVRLTSNGGGTAKDAARTPKELGSGYPEPGRLGILPAYAVYARHVRGLELANIHCNFLTNELRSAASFVDVQGLLIDNFQPQLAQGVKAAVFAGDVKDVTVRDSPTVNLPAGEK
ncbi:MAG TPA: glycoside hydrolase family 28 protein [Candidatus Acidoferrales bacterium]|nr:glycoside hydrolase family 28 protein [Candidatus Acidoferrales bacterium]